jgi:hypothetical protein
MSTPLPEEHHENSLPTSPGQPPEDHGESDDRLTEMQALAMKAAHLHQQSRNGSNWFYWVGALSLVNSLILLNGGKTFFVIGLGITLLVDVLGTSVAQRMPQNAQAITVVTFAVDVLIALFVAGFGWLAAKRYQTAFLLGMALYLLDGLLFVLFQDWMSVAFHAFALFCMWNGFKAYRQLDAVEVQLQHLRENNQESAPAPSSHEA